MVEWLGIHPEFYAWVVLPCLILLARVADVTIGTARVIFVSRGYKLMAAAAGFWEVLIWLLAIGQVMKNLTNPMCYIAYATGFAVGNFVGILVAQKLSLGVVLVRILTHESADLLIESLKSGDYGVTSLDGRGAFGPMKVIFTIVRRHRVDDVVKIIQTHNPNAFYSVEEIDQVSTGKLAPRKFGGRLSFLRFFSGPRRGK